MGLQAKLALALVPLLAGPVLALGWLSYDALRDDLHRESLDGMDAALRLADNAVKVLVGTAKANVELFATSQAVERYARTADEYERYYLLQPGLLRLLYSYRDAYPEYLEIRFLMPDGSEDAAVEAPGRDAGTGAGGLDAMVPTLASDPNLLSVTLRPDRDGYALYVYRRIALPQHYGTPADGNYITRGYLALTVSLEAVRTALTHLPFDFGGHVILALPDGRVLFDTEGAFEGDVLPSGLVALLQVGSRNASVRRHQHWDERRWLVGSRYLEPGLYAIAGLPEEALSDPLGSLAFNILALTSLSLLLLGAVLVGSLHRLVLRPLDSLREAADRIGAGELRPRIPIHSQDELGTLAAAVRGMGERLAHYRGEVERMAFHDQLTGLPNRLLIRELLSNELERARAVGRTVAVLFFDLDNFKQINDALGHTTGDELLRALARRLSALLETAPEGRRTHLARLGGDELLIVLGEPAHVEEVADLAGSLLDATALPFDLGVAHFVVTTSIGVAFYPRDATDPDGLIHCADLAMYAAKAEGRNAVRCFSQELNAGLAARLHMENALRQAIGRGQLALRYQPIVELGSGRLWAFEALLRWTHPEFGEVPPQLFIPVAEETGLIQEIGHWVLAETCRQIVAWRERGLQTVPVSVNVSAAQIRREDLARSTARLLAQLGLSARDLHLEITESLLVDLSQTGNARLCALSDLGLAIHVDDFGTGYSSLSYLRRLAIDVIKIDRSFVDGMVEQEEDRALVSAMIAMAHALNLRVIAEGIEKREQLEVLRGLGCDLGQGFFFPLPADADAAAALLNAGVPGAAPGTPGPEPWSHGDGSLHRVNQGGL